MRFKFTFLFPIILNNFKCPHNLKYVTKLRNYGVLLFHMHGMLCFNVASYIHICPILCVNYKHSISEFHVLKANIIFKIQTHSWKSPVSTSFLCRKSKLATSRIVLIQRCHPYRLLSCQIIHNFPILPMNIDLYTEIFIQVAFLTFIGDAIVIIKKIVLDITTIHIEETQCKKSFLVCGLQNTCTFTIYDIWGVVLEKALISNIIRVL